MGRSVLSLDPSGTIQVRLLYLWVHMLNHNSIENSKKSRKTLATSILNKRGLSPKSVLMAMGRQMGVYFLVLLFIQASVQAGKVEFKHHNNTEMAEVLQQIHNRCPDITRLYTLSETSVNGVPLYVLEFTDHPGKHEIMETEMKFLGVNYSSTWQPTFVNLIKPKMRMLGN